MRCLRCLRFGIGSMPRFRQPWRVRCRRLWELDGAISLTGWMKQRAGMTARAAGSAAGVATRLHRLPATREAWRAGDLSGGQVAVIAAAVRAEHEELFAEQESEVIGAIAGLDVRDTARVMRHWTELAEDVTDPPPAPVRDRSLRASRLLDDRVVLDADLDADSGEVVLSALRLAESPDARHRSPHARSAASGCAGGYLPVLPRPPDPPNRSPPSTARECRGGGGRSLRRSPGPIPHGNAARSGDGRRHPLRRRRPPHGGRPLRRHPRLRPGHEDYLGRVCGRPWWCGTKAAGSPDATESRSGARPTTWCGSQRAARPPSGTW